MAPSLLDDFNRANSVNLDSNWALVPSSAPVSPQIVSNAAKISNSPASAGAWLPDLFGSDQEVSVTIKGTDVGGGSHGYLLAQMPIPWMSTFTGYVLDFDFTSGTQMTFTLFRGNAGSFTTLHTTTGVSYATTDIFTLRKVGSELTALKNGVAVSGWPLIDPAPLNASDTYIGFGGYGATALTFDDFTGGDVGETEEPPPPETPLTEIDILLLEQGPEVPLIGFRKIGEPVTTDATVGFGLLNKILVKANVTSIRGNQNPSVTIVVEGSSDGLEWDTLHTWNFTNSGIQYTLLDTPPDQLRTVITMGGELREAIIGGVLVIPSTIDYQ